MPTPSFSARLHDAGAALSPRAGWIRSGPSAGPNRRIVLLALIGVVGLLALVYLVLRLTPLSAVQRVTVVGAQGPEAPQIRRAIEDAAMGQSTLGFGDGAVHQAIEGTSSITGVTIHTKFPHAVQIEVHQRLAVGAVEEGGKRVSVSSDGKLLPDWTPGKLPLIRGARTERGVVTGAALRATAILGAAPAELLAHVARVDGGTTVRLASGPALLFRNTDRVAAKWAAAVAVLNDARTAGATWIDLRVPDQPVAGKGAPPVLPAADAKAGKVGTTDDALATAEDRAADPAADPAAGADGTATDAAATAASTASTGAASTPAAAPVTSAATTPTAPAATTTGGAPTATGSAATGTGTPSTATGATTNSGSVSPGTTPSTSGTAGSTSGGGTAPTGQITP